MSQLLNPIRRALLACAALVCVQGALAADAYPSKPIKLIVPFPPGGAVDFYARTVQPELQRVLGQPVVIENRTGASGMIGSEAVAKAAPDGYTLLVGNIATYAMNAGIYRKMPYDPVKDLAPIFQTVMVPYVLAVTPGLPAKTVPELLAWGKAHPGQLSYGSSGSGSAQHMAAELFKARTGADWTHVPYKGVGALVTDLIAGHVQVVFADQSSLMPHIQAGKLRLLATAGTRRLAELPEVPTIAEAAKLPGFEVSGWQGISGPAGLPPAVAKRLHEALAQVQGSPAMTEKLRAAGLTPVGAGPEDFSRHVQAEIGRWSKVARDIGATVD